VFAKLYRVDDVDTGDEDAIFIPPVTPNAVTDVVASVDVPETARFVVVAFVIVAFVAENPKNEAMLAHSDDKTFRLVTDDVEIVVVPRVVVAADSIEVVAFVNVAFTAVTFGALIL